MGCTLGGGVSAVSSSEGVVHEDVCVLAQLHQKGRGSVYETGLPDNSVPLAVWV